MTEPTSNSNSEAVAPAARMRPKKLKGPPAIKNKSVKSRSRLPARDDSAGGSRRILRGTVVPESPGTPDGGNNSSKKNKSVMLSNGYVSAGLSPSAMLSSTSNTNADGTKNRARVNRANTVRAGQQWNNPLQGPTASSDNGNAVRAASPSPRQRQAPPRNVSDSAVAFRPPAMLNGQRSDRNTHDQTDLPDNGKGLSQLQIMRQATMQSRRNVDNPQGQKEGTSRLERRAPQPQHSSQSRHKALPAIDKTATQHDFSDTVIAPTPQQESLMRQISALGLEDPVFDRLKLGQHQQQKDGKDADIPALFGYQQQDVPEDMMAFLGCGGGGKKQPQEERQQQHPQSPSCHKSIRNSSKSLSNNTKATSTDVTGEPPSPDEKEHSHHRRSIHRNSKKQQSGSAKITRSSSFSSKKKKSKQHPPAVPKSPASNQRSVNPFSSSDRRRSRRRASADMVHHPDEIAFGSSPAPVSSSVLPRAPRSKTPTRMSSTRRSGSVRRSIRTMFHKDPSSSKNKNNSSGNGSGSKSSSRKTSQLPHPTVAGSNSITVPVKKWQPIEYHTAVVSPPSTATKPKKKPTWQGAPAPLHATATAPAQ